MPVDSQPTPISLLERLREQARSEDWDRFVELYTPLLISWTRRLGVPPNDLRDLVQDIFLTLVAKLRTFHHDGSRRFRGWLWTVTVNKVRDQMRRRDTPPGEVVELDGLPDSDNVAAWAEADYRLHLQQQAIRIMQQDFAETTWRACWLCVVENQSPAEVARVLNISLDTVYQAKHRVLRRLRQELAGLLE